MQVNGIARSESDVIQTSFEKFNSSKRVRVGFLWALINFMLAAFAITEMYVKCISMYIKNIYFHN